LWCKYAAFSISIFLRWNGSTALCTLTLDK
jgi:hypothetical protein